MRKRWQPVLLTISTYADIDNDVAFDGDWGNPDYWGADGPYDFTDMIVNATSTNELRLRIKAISDNSMDWSSVYTSNRLKDNDITDLYNGDVFRRQRRLLSCVEQSRSARWASRRHNSSVSLRRARSKYEIRQWALTQLIQWMVVKFLSSKSTQTLSMVFDCPWLQAGGLT